MDRAQFMKQLERLLSDISEAEKQEALAYYNSYFDEAGPENEASVIRELGSPGKVAAIIKADLDESNEEYAQYTENGYEDLRENKASYMPEIRQRDGEHAGKTDRIHRGYRPKEKGSNSRFILILIALVFLSPFIITAASGVFSILLVVILFPAFWRFCIRSCGVRIYCSSLRLHWCGSWNFGYQYCCGTSGNGNRLSFVCIRNSVLHFNRMAGLHNFPMDPSQGDRLFPENRVSE